MKKATVHIVEDDSSLSKALSLMVKSLDYQVMTYNNARIFLDNYKPAHPECLLLDIRMPEMSGLELQQTFNKTNTNIPIVFLSGHGDIDMAVVTMKAGAVDFITKPPNQQRLIDSINLALRTDQEQFAQQEECLALEKNLAQLSKRESEILQLLLEGKLSKSIGDELKISSNTVDTHRANILKKLSFNSIHKLLRQLYLHNVQPFSEIKRKQISQSTP